MEMIFQMMSEPPLSANEYSRHLPSDVCQDKNQNRQQTKKKPNKRLHGSIFSLLSEMSYEGISNGEHVNKTSLYVHKLIIEET